MNYSRIYEQFITDRRARPEPEGYCEVHHIVPRSLGGGDEPENLVKLTPEDHFFAHLLLAKIHGGVLWVPVVMWLGGDRRNWTGRRSRLGYGWARRGASRAVSGDGAWQYDTRVFDLEHKDGARFNGTQYEFSGRFGLDRSGVCMLVNGILASYKGWYRAGNRPKFVGRGSRRGIDHPMVRSDTIRLLHVDGREFVGSPYEFRLLHGVSRSSVSRLVNGRQLVASGWHFPDAALPKTGRGAKYARSV